ncbi:MoaD/ThiS family protein [Pontixanthobacter aquaemixtae]|uniref:MoaD/ThiS family protein n=1 Tax=Pontixanthobacter aquaemixtae TaxID=1958940 RepID=A0A844ZQB8_9SPHN|nr:MoaD/ThiS family protein [Pontixanthobacter aquaemixtae]MXO89734.1 MoaD/ThiS family protein [Pontixanthobacter aquaemixtae]
MTARILFLGPLADLAGAAEMQAQTPLDWAGLLSLVNAETKAELQNERINVACGGKVLAVKSELMAQDGDEVALLPPVSGG